MVQVTQTEDEVKIVIELNRLLNRRPDIVLLPTYLKFNNPPIFFERHLTDEIDEVASSCKIFKHEARIVLVKKNKGIWPEVFQKLSKEELNQKRLEISDIIIEQNKEKDKKALERYDQKKRVEIDREIRRESAIRDRVTAFEGQACKDAMMVGVKKEACKKPQDEKIAERKKVLSANIANSLPRTRPSTQLRASGKISFSFSKFAPVTPKRESQQLPCSAQSKVDNNAVD